jgi:hypothetical protein
LCTCCTTATGLKPICSKIINIYIYIYLYSCLYYRLIILPRRRGQKIPQKPWYLSTRLCGITSQNLRLFPNTCPLVRANKSSLVIYIKTNFLLTWSLKAKIVGSEKGFRDPVPRQRLSQQVSTATNMQATKEELLETVFSMQSVPRLYN